MVLSLTPFAVCDATKRSKISATVWLLGCLNNCFLDIKNGHPAFRKMDKKAGCLVFLQDITKTLENVVFSRACVFRTLWINLKFRAPTHYASYMLQLSRSTTRVCRLSPRRTIRVDLIVDFYLSIDRFNEHSSTEPFTFIRT